MISTPITDWFGTVLQPEDLCAGLVDCGLERSRLVIDDDGLTIEFSEGAATDDIPSRALTWIRTQFSPLVPARLLHVEGLEGSTIQDARASTASRITLVEIADPDDFAGVVRHLAEGASELLRPDAAVADPVDDERFAGVVEHFRDLWGAALVDADQSAVPLHWWAGPGARVSLSEGAQLIVWYRRGKSRGVAPAFIAALVESRADGAWLLQALSGAAPPRDDLLLVGLTWGASRRPTVARRGSGGPAIGVDASRCDGCGICETQCPVGYLTDRGEPTTPDAAACIRCYECVDACPVDALRPAFAADTHTSSRTLAHRPGWLAQLSGAAGEPSPAPFTPSYLLHAASSSTPRVVLGLAVLTMQEHSAALVIDGELVGAVEEEKLARERHYGWRSPGRPPFVTPTVDPTICLEEVLCRRSVRWLLAEHGLTLDDVDLIAVNGLHGRFRRGFSLVDADAPLPTLRAGRVVYVPHHLAHAASAYRLSENKGGWVLTIDGRGDRETAGVFEVVGGALEPRRTVLSLTDRSIGGVYEGVTRVLGFGSHGQGSLMALAGFGDASMDFSEILHVSNDGHVTVHESGVDERFAPYRRSYDEPLTEAHYDLAASVQAALEATAVQLVHSVTGQDRLSSLALAGGVALNCHMNDLLRREFEVESVFAQPGANDGGTSVGAAAEALWWSSGLERLSPMRTASLGPRFDDATILDVLDRYGVPHQRVDSIATEAASRIADGQVVAWFQGALEFGPRALGARSLLADPRSARAKVRLNAIKSRQDWRPFGPSVLAGFEHEWFEQPLDSPFMLFTLRVLGAQRHRIPAVMHVDGTTRPQLVHSDALPAYHELIKEFHQLTDVPMIVNTSFNRRGEAIVATPEDALASFWELRADALAIGPFIIEHPSPLALGRPNPPMGPLQGPPRRRALPARTLLHSSHEPTHDQITGAPGSFRRTLGALHREKTRGATATIHVPVRSQSRKELAGLIIIAADANARVRFSLAPPLEHQHGVETRGWSGAELALQRVGPALRLATKRGVEAELDGFPICALSEPLRALQPPTTQRLAAVAPLPCRRCSLRSVCPMVSAATLEVLGSSWLHPE